ncbi:single-stranded DNA-binding protein [Muribaculaceae bacterium Isolate-037 (Harlan)]|nr:single-stranded DNA-binding protein [Muribaculaceae bacterium Isolate-037 (Harlan)]
MEANNTATANSGKKNIVNSTVVTGFVATEPKIRNFAETSVIRFALAVRNRTTNNVTNEVTTQSSLITVEKWAKNTDLSSFDAIRKGILVEVKGMLKPNEWTGNDGVHRNRIIIGARSVKEIARPASQLGTAAPETETAAAVA